MIDPNVLKDIKSTPLFNFDKERDEKGDRIGFFKKDIEKIIPHRFPFLLIDSIADLKLDDLLICGERFIDPEDPIFQGHFPDKPIYPGVLQIEMMAQLGLCLSYFILNQTTTIHSESKPVIAVMTRVHIAGFNAPVLPNDRLSIYAKILYQDTLMGLIAGQIYCNHQLCSYTISEACFYD
jgi:3-hydroxyacyl-[acyl-carrier-protein] dehydratase